MRVKAAVDIWIKVILYFASAILVAGVLFVPHDDLLLYLIIVMPLLTFLLWIFFGTFYELREEYLYCRSGPFFEKIYYDKIRSAKLSRNLLSSMALSRKRIEIRQHGKGYITGTTMISPVNREEFLKQLLAKCKNLEGTK